MTVLPAATVLPDRRSVIALLLIAASHAALGLYEGFADDDFSLLLIDAFFLVLVMAVGAAGLYLIGLFHLPQAIAAAVVTYRRLNRS